MNRVVSFWRVNYVDGYCVALPVSNPLLLVFIERDVSRKHCSKIIKHCASFDHCGTTS